MNTKTKNSLSSIMITLMLIASFAAIPLTTTPVSAQSSDAAIDAGDSPPLPPNPGQDDIYLNGALHEAIDAIYTGNSANVEGWTKYSANKEEIDIIVNDVTIGHFTFDKKGNGPNNYEDFLVITIYDSIGTLPVTTVHLRWFCGNYYAYAALMKPGTYYIPKLMQDNGKIDDFNQIWLRTSKRDLFNLPEYGWAGLAALVTCFVSLFAFYGVKSRAKTSKVNAGVISTSF